MSYEANVYCIRNDDNRPAKLRYAVVSERGYFVYRLISIEWLGVPARR